MSPGSPLNRLELSIMAAPSNPLSRGPSGSGIPPCATLTARRSRDNACRSEMDAAKKRPAAGGGASWEGRARKGKWTMPKARFPRGERRSSGRASPRHNVWHGPSSPLPDQRVFDGGSALHLAGRRARHRLRDAVVKADEQLAGGEQDDGDDPGRHDAFLRCRVKRGARIERSLRHDMASKSDVSRVGRPSLVSEAPLCHAPNHRSVNVFTL